MLKKTIILLMLQLGIHPQDDDDHHHHITVEEGWDDIVERIKYIFSDEVSSSKVVSRFPYTLCILVSSTILKTQSLYMIN